MRRTDAAAKFASSALNPQRPPARTPPGLCGPTPVRAGSTTRVERGATESYSLELPAMSSRSRPSMGIRCPYPQESRRSTVVPASALGPFCNGPTQRMSGTRVAISTCTFGDFGLRQSVSLDCAPALVLNSTSGRPQRLQSLGVNGTDLLSAEPAVPRSACAPACLRLRIHNTTG